MEQFDEIGLFWLPDDPTHPRPGRLTFQHGAKGLQLSLLNPFEDLGSFMAAMATSHPGYAVIFGLLQNDDIVTLTNSVVDGANVKFGGAGTSRVDILPRYVFRGAHLPQGEETRFNDIELRFEHLDAWAFSGEDLVTQAPETGDLVVSNQDPSDVEAQAFGGTVRISYWTARTTGASQAQFERTASISLEVGDPQTISSLGQSFSVPIQQFLTFACGVPTKLLSMRLRAEGLGRQVGEHWLATTVEVAYRGWPSPSGDDAPVQMRMTLVTIRDQFGDVLRAWETLQGEQQRAMTLLFAISLGIDLYLDNQFLFAVQASELFHRKHWPDGVLPKEQHQDRINAIVGSVADEGQKKWLKAKLAFSNEPTLKERLARMVEFAGDEAHRFLRNDFVKVAGDTRNYLTHFNPDLKPKAAEGEDLWILSKECIALLEFCILRGLGLDGPTSLRMSAATSTFQLLMQRSGAMQSPIQVTLTKVDPDQESAAEADPGGQADGDDEDVPSGSE